MAIFKKSDEQRYNARMKRQARWQKPMLTLQHRVYAYMNMIFVDHGIFRMLYLNLHSVTPNFWRAAQPTPSQIAKLAQNGIKTIVNLRGGREHGSWPLEVDACEKNNIILQELTLRSREAPSVEAILAAKALFETMQTPALIHCKSGADRAGIASALYLLLIEKTSIREAKQQLSMRFGHFSGSKTGILDAFLNAYEAAFNLSGIEFLTWVQTQYSPERITKNFKPSFLSMILGDKILVRE